jgi:hypothetical protein
MKRKPLMNTHGEEYGGIQRGLAHSLPVIAISGFSEK